jgi:hypothetical protein
MQQNQSGLRFLSAIAVFLFSVAICYPQSAPPKPDRSGIPAELNGNEGSITGYVRDLACPYRNPSKDAAKPPDDSCVKECARAGAPLGIITEDGTIFHVISSSLPDVDERQKLLPYIAKTVHVTGKLFERNGSHAVAIEKIEAVLK